MANSREKSTPRAEPWEKASGSASLVTSTKEHSSAIKDTDYVSKISLTREISNIQTNLSILQYITLRPMVKYSSTK